MTTPPPDNPDRELDRERYANFLAVNHDRAQLGRPPLRYSEFVSVGKLLRGARDYWTPEKLAEKAKKQLRDPKSKRWVTQRGSIPDAQHRAARARIGKDEETDELNIGAVGKRFILDPPPKSSPTTKVTRLSNQAGLKAMVNAGHNPKEVIERYNGRGVIFRVDNPGENPVHVFVANPKAMVAERMVIQDNNVGNAESALENFQEQYAAHIKAGLPEYTAKLAELQQKVVAAKQLRTRQKARAEAHYGTGGDEAIGEMEQALAAEAAALFMKATEDWPQWKMLRSDGRPTPFILEFDESKLVKGETKGPLPAADITQGPNARAHGSERINFSRVRFREELKSDQEETMPTDLETAGQHAVAHEVGHLLDTRGPKGKYPWDSNEDKFDSFVQASREVVDGDYISQGARPNREWFAEMHALSKQDPETLLPEDWIAVQAYLNMWMISRVARPASPSTEWIAAHNEWLQDALDAAADGDPLPRLPDPADFFEGPKPKIQKKKSWTLPSW